MGAGGPFSGQNASGVLAAADSYNYRLWTGPQRLNANWSQSIQPRIAVDTIGRGHVIWMDGEWGAGVPWKPWTIYYARRGTGGHWSVPAVLGQGISPSIAGDGAGDVHVVWVDTRSNGSKEYYGVYHLRWDGASRTWDTRDPVIVYAENPWEERPFDIWARFRVPVPVGR